MSMSGLAAGLLALGGVAKVAGATVMASWKDIGGAAIIFTAIRAYIFGRTFRTLEYPRGPSHLVTLRVPTVDALKRHIARANNVPVDEVRACYLWTNQFFTEPLESVKHLRQVNDYEWILWTKKTEPIPSRGVTLATLVDTEEIHGTEANKIHGCLHLVAKLSLSADPKQKITSTEADMLVDAVMEKDHFLIMIYTTFKDNPDLFRDFALRYVYRKRTPEPPLLSTPATSDASIMKNSFASKYVGLGNDNPDAPPPPPPNEEQLKAEQTDAAIEETLQKGTESPDSNPNNARSSLANKGSGSGSAADEGSKVAALWH
eukprot:gnl/Hemi2/25829_TR8693_c0_g1_i1.p1 gnl/Hemi2/25829_TR8693_c0_g1~~gnl/Hemi2/25829_TR8693_c0_g1_i1.p1  ORF type:complete len:334 (+),score=95.97 gnl/Hemi2/25829_TR8693_c0_g1_i1:52-1002(+)